MLSFIKELFGKLFGDSKPAAPAPYKVEAPAATAKPAKKPTVKKATTKPRKPRAPKA